MKTWFGAFLVWGYLLQGLLAFRVVCVYTNWSQYRPNGGKFLPEDVDPSMCTHLIYVYAKLQGNKLVAAEWNDEGTTWSEGMFDRVQNLKQVNPELKTLLGVGGWMMGSKDFSRMASRAASRKMFAIHAVKYLRDRKFDGLTIDWQYPTSRGGRPYDRKNFSYLLKEIRRAIEDDSKTSNQPALLLSVGVSASKDIIDSAYEIDNITRYSDFINVLAFDLHGAWDNYTGHPSQLYSRKEEFGPSTEVNVDAVMRYWISNVPDRSKLNLGMSTYGRTFTLRKARHHEYNVPTTGPGLEGEYTKQPGMLAYYERCAQYPDATRVWDDFSKVAYWYGGDQWIAGEDIESVKAKVRWMKQHSIGGMTIWSLDTDDFFNTCSGGSYPIMQAVQDEIQAPFIPSTTQLTTAALFTTETVTTNTPQTTTHSTTTAFSKTLTTRKITQTPSIKGENVKTIKKVPEKKPSHPMEKEVKTTMKSQTIQVKQDANLNNNEHPSNINGTNSNESIVKESDQKTSSKPQNKNKLMSRNDNPNNNKTGTSKPIHVGNRIVVRRKKVLRRRKNGRKPIKKPVPKEAKTEVPQDTIKKTGAGNQVKRQNTESSSTAKKDNILKTKTNANKIKSEKEIVPNVKNVTSQNRNPKSNKSEDVQDLQPRSKLNVDVRQPQSEALKGALKEQTGKTEPAANNTTIKTNVNTKPSNGKKGQINNKTKGRKVVRRVPRKLTKKQIETLKRRRWLQRQRQRKQKRRNKQNTPKKESDSNQKDTKI